jgi:hypothetical protein
MKRIFLMGKQAIVPKVWRSNDGSYLAGRLLVCLIFALLFVSPAFAAGSGKNFSAAELKLMSTFLSNFTELGFMNFDAKTLTNPNDPADMIRFGIWHNYRNNFKSRVSPCKVKGCKWGSLTIEGRYVTESVKKYFDVSYTKLASVTESDPPYYYDGKIYHFEGADGEAVYFARADKAFLDTSGHVVMILLSPPLL